MKHLGIVGSVLLGVLVGAGSFGCSDDDQAAPDGAPSDASGDAADTLSPDAAPDAPVDASPDAPADAAPDAAVGSASCTAVEPGEGGSFAVSGQIDQLVADPVRCAVYGLIKSTPSQIVVIDTGTKTELTRVILPGLAQDLDISPSGSYLVAGQNEDHTISIIDTASLTVAATVPTVADPLRVEVDDDGFAYYVAAEEWYTIRRIDLTVGVASDVMLDNTADDPVIDLASDGASLYVGDTNTSGGTLYRFDLAGGGTTMVDQSTYDDGYGFSYPSNLHVGASGRHVYYADHSLDAGRLSFLDGRTGEQVLVEDAAGSFAIGTDHLFDAALVRPVAPLAQPISAAALTDGDRELWSYSNQLGRLYYQSTAELVGGVALGQREVAPDSLSSYSFAELIHDPIRPRLYGVDSARGAVVVIDEATLLPTAAILVGSTPTDLSVDPAGATLYVGHLDMMAYGRIDLESDSFIDFVAAPRDTYLIQALGGNRVVTLDEDQWTRPTIMADSGEIIASGSTVYEGALSLASDGTTLYIGESGLTTCTLFRFDLSSGTLAYVDQTDWEDSFEGAARVATALPDASGVYFGNYLLDGADLSILRYPTAEPIRWVTSDGRLALSTTHVYAVADGAERGTLPASTGAIALSPDGQTAFLFTGSAIVTADLSGL
jgi:YVTN family beta-propeller protein